MGYNGKLKRNAEGYIDPMAYELLKKEEVDAKRFKRVLATIFYICDLAGFHVENRIELRDVETNKIWR